MLPSRMDDVDYWANKGKLRSFRPWCGVTEEGIKTLAQAIAAATNTPMDDETLTNTARECVAVETFLLAKRLAGTWFLFNCAVTAFAGGMVGYRLFEVLLLIS